MKKQWKRLAALSSAAVMAAGTLLYFPTDTLQNISWGITASAEETGAGTESGTQTWNEDNLTWTLTADGTLTISGTGAMKDYFHDSPATQKKDIVKKVVIEEGVTSIGDYAFESCNKLASITIPSSATSIGAGVFNHCSSLKEVLLENGSKLTSGQLGVNESIIGTYWNEDNLTWTLTADGTMTISGSGAMKDYDNDNSPATQKKDNVKKVVIEDEITSIGNNAFSDCSNLASIEIPEGVTSIGIFVFFDCSRLTGITIPNSVTSIGIDAFSWCSSLASINIPSSVTSIGESAFVNCIGLTSITIPKSVTSIGTYTFSGCGNLTEITVPCDSTLTKNAFGDASEKVKYRHSDVV